MRGGARYSHGVEKRSINLKKGGGERRGGRAGTTILNVLSSCPDKEDKLATNLKGEGGQVY